MSLAKKIAGPLNVVSISLLSILGVVIVMSNAQSVTSSMESKVESIASFLSKASAPYIRNYDAYALDGFAKEAVKDSDIEYVIFNRANGDLFTEAHRTEQGQDTVEVVKEIVDGDVRIGQLKLGYNQKRMKSSVRELVWIDIFTIISEQIFLFLGLFLVIRRYTAPLQALVSALRKISSSGDYSVRMQNFPESNSDVVEFNNITREFDSMLEQIQGRDLSIHNANTVLEVKVAERTLELSEMLETLQSTQHSLIESSKFSALGVMAGGVAHEINNPLTIISMSTERIIKACESPEYDLAAVISHCEKTRLAIQRISKIVTGLRIFCHDSDGDPFQFESVNKILEDTLSFCLERFKSHGIEMILKHDEVDSRVFCRATEISQILINLFNNAFDEIQKLENERWICVEIKHKNSFVSIEVSNSGPPINPELHSKIFQPFFTTKVVGQGTGLGLSISKGIAEAHGGTLRLEPNFPHAKFILMLPLKSS